MIFCKMLYNIIRNYRAQGVIGIIALSVPVELFSHVSLSETVWYLVRVSKLSEEGGEQLVEGTDVKRRGTCELLCICGVPWRHFISVTVLEMLKSTKGIHL